MRPSPRAIATLSLGIAAACADAPTSAPDLPAAVAPRAATLQLYGHGSHAGVGTACADAGYRGLDFWVGHWLARNVNAPAGVPDSPSIIERELDGCVIEENWVGAARSINTWDAASGTYNQHYLDANGGVQLLSGGAQPDGSMRMSGTIYVNCPTCPGGFFPIRNVWTWTAITPDSVRQHQQLFNGFNGNQIPGGFDGRYRRVAEVTLNPNPGPFRPCESIPVYAELDFLVGDWVVTSGRALGVEVASGNGPVTASVTRTLVGCLVEETVDGPGGYRGWSFNSWNNALNYRRWYRTYADNRGDRVFLSGALDGGAMVMTGTRSLADGTRQDVRVTFAPDGADRVLERWELTTDGGATWEPLETVTRVRRG